MKTATIEIFTFEELSESAKEAARNAWRYDADWAWADDWWHSVQEFSKIAPIKVTSVDYVRAEFEGGWDIYPTAAEELSGLRAWKWLQNNGWFDLANKNAMGECTLTGFCGDCDLFDPIEKYARDPLNVPPLIDLFSDCIYSWVFAARRDYEHSQSDEYIDECLIENGYEFTADGRMYVWG